MKRQHYAIGLLLFLLAPLVISCKSGTSDTDTAPRTYPTPSDAARKSNSIYEFKQKTEELWTSGSAAQPDAKARIKGKVAFVRRIISGHYSMPFFLADKSEVNEKEAADYGFKPDEIALSPDETDTLLKVTCEKGKQLGQYVVEDKREVPAFAQECAVEVIDYKTTRRFAERKFTSRYLQKNIELSASETEVVASPPYYEVIEYIKSLKGK